MHDVKVACWSSKHSCKHAKAGGAHPCDGAPHRIHHILNRAAGQVCERAKALNTISSGAILAMCHARVARWMAALFFVLPCQSHCRRTTHLHRHGAGTLPSSGLPGRMGTTRPRSTPLGLSG